MFSTHLGLRRHKRLMFGINAAPEIFQNVISQLLAGLPGCKNISDDTIVFGQDQEEHDANLQRVHRQKLGAFPPFRARCNQRRENSVARYTEKYLPDILKRKFSRN